MIGYIAINYPGIDECLLLFNLVPFTPDSSTFAIFRVTTFTKSSGDSVLLRLFEIG